MSVKAKVKIKDTGATKKSIREFFGARNASVKVGVFGDAAEEQEEGSPYTVAQIAEVHEFGLGHVPERSFLRAYIDENEDRLIQILLYLMAAEVTKAARTGTPISRAMQQRTLAKLGLLMVSEIQKRISAGIAPPLAPQTIARKGSSTPLINTGQLRASITHQVELGK